MRVLLVGPLPPPTGGVATHLRDLSRALGGAEILDPRGGRGHLLARLALARARGEIVHLHTNGHNPKSWLLAIACGGPRAILTLHSGLAPDFIATRRRLARIGCWGYARIVAVNPAIAGALVEAGVEEARIVVCAAFTPTALDFRITPPGLRGLRRRYTPLVAAALAPGPEYGAELLLDGLARVREKLPRAGLVVYGPRTRELAPVARSRGLDGAVAFLGELDRARVLAVLAAADLFVRPTFADGDAVSVREALALGRPVVASATGARPTGVRLFPVGSAADLAEEIFRTVGSDGAHPATATFDCVPTLFQIYRSLVVETVGTGLAT